MKTGGWDTPGLMRAIKKKSMAGFVLLKGWLSVLRCHRTSSHVAPLLRLEAERCSTKEDLCISKPLLKSRKKPDIFSGARDQKD